jgi:SAM-dependent methyltransferase
VTGSIHATSWRSEDAGATYERGRPDYPAEAVAFMIQLVGDRVLDLAAGTGKLTRLLAPAVRQPLAAEPMDGMRRQFREALPGVRLLAANAEALPLRAGTLDGITVAQAFHWFRADEALAEAHRVLRPGGRLVLVWNKRDLTVPWIRRMTDILDRYERLAPREDMDAWRPAFDRTDLFTPLQQRSFRHEQQLDSLVDRVGSMSFVIVLPPGERARLLEEIEALVDERPIRMTYDTHVYWCQRRR